MAKKQETTISLIELAREIEKEKAKKYQYLVDNGLSEYLLSDEKYRTITDAVFHASRNCYGMEFFIIEIIDWKATKK